MTLLAANDYAAIAKAMRENQYAGFDRTAFDEMNALDHDGTKCPRCNSGTLKRIHDGICCACHLHPPCGFCLNARLRCDNCDLEGVGA